MSSAEISLHIHSSAMREEGGSAGGAVGARNQSLANASLPFDAHGCMSVKQAAGGTHAVRQAHTRALEAAGQICL